MNNLSFFNIEGQDIFHINEIHISRSVLESLDEYGVGYVVSGLVASAIVASYFKSSIYLYMYDNRK